jgi:predicted transporter
VNDLERDVEGVALTVAGIWILSRWERTRAEKRTRGQWTMPLPLIFGFIVLAIAAFFVLPVTVVAYVIAYGFIPACFVFGIRMGIHNRRTTAK